MKIRHILRIVVTAIATVTLFVLATSPVFAAGNQSNQAMNQPAMLFAPDPDLQISIYPKPDSHQRRIGYGLSGDPVTVLEQVGSNAGYTWNYIQFDPPSQLEGWVQQDFIALQATPDRSVLNKTSNQRREYNSGDAYLGNQRSRQDHQRSQRSNSYNSYSQQ